MTTHRWEDRNTVLLRIPNNYSWKQNVISFSLDDTLIRNKTGNVVPRNEKDWEFIYPDTIEKIVSYSEFASIAIITHDKRIGAGKIGKHVYKNRLDNVLDELRYAGVECIAIVGTCMNCFSKPHTKLWKLLLSTYERAKKPLPITNKCIYVGNMGGHLASKAGSVWGNQPKDAGYYDRAFAHNVGMRYWSPHVFFNIDMYDPKLNPKDYPLRPAIKKIDETTAASDSDNDDETEHKSSIPTVNAISAVLGSTITPSKSNVAQNGKNVLSTVTPSRTMKKNGVTQKIPFRQSAYGDALSREELEEAMLLHTAEETRLSDVENAIRKLTNPHIMIILVGQPGSGKTVLTSKLVGLLQKRNIERGNVLGCVFVINSETGTARKCVRVAQEHIRGEADIVIDACNPSVADRRKYLSLLANESYSVLIIKMEMSDRLARHMTCLRVEHTTSFTLEETPTTAYTAYNKKYQDPTDEEMDGDIMMISYTPPMPSSDIAFWYTY